MAEVSRIVDAVQERVRPAVLGAGFAATSCVVTVRVTIDVLRYFGIFARPVPVQALILNAEAVRVAENSGMDELMRVVQQFTASDVGGPWTIGLGVGDSAEGAGHVVVGVPSESTMLDLSLDQATRPSKNLEFAPFVGAVDVPQWFSTVGERIAYEIPQTDGNAALLYTHVKNDRYKQSPNWERVSAGDTMIIPQLTSRLIRQIRADLA